MVFPPTKITFLTFSSDSSVGCFTLFESELESSTLTDSSFVISPVCDSATAAASASIFFDTHWSPLLTYICPTFGLLISSLISNLDIPLKFITYLFFLIS